MKYWPLFLAVFMLMNISCASNPPVVENSVEDPPIAVLPEPEPVEQPPVQVQTVVETPPTPPAVPVFNPASISQEVFDTAKADIQRLVEDLNRIIRAGNYNTWLTYLSEEYRNRINSREFLNEINTYPGVRGRINSARDYFNYVVVPSRANDHVDDIEFISQQEVRAYTLGSQGQRLVLYDLEYINNRWMIVQ
jgi:hypothetical protein